MACLLESQTRNDNNIFFIFDLANIEGHSQSAQQGDAVTSEESGTWYLEHIIQIN